MTICKFFLLHIHTHTTFVVSLSTTLFFTLFFRLFMGVYTHICSFLFLRFCSLYAFTCICIYIYTLLDFPSLPFFFGSSILNSCCFVSFGHVFLFVYLCGYFFFVVRSFFHFLLLLFLVHCKLSSVCAL